jgi:hypothetical protein
MRRRTKADPAPPDAPAPAESGRAEPPRPERRPPAGDERRHVGFARALGLAFCGAGFVAIVLGWNGMARVTCPDCQLPYLLSAGAVGLGLIVFGATLLLLGQIRAERLRNGEQIRDLVRELRAGPAEQADPGPAPSHSEPAPASPVSVTTPAAIPPDAAATTPPVAAAPGSGSEPGDLDLQVLTGRTSYHLLDCPVTKGKQGLGRLSLGQALELDLAPCRVCRPPARPEAEPLAGPPPLPEPPLSEPAPLERSAPDARPVSAGRPT